MDELSNQDQRNKLAEIIFDLEKLNPDISSGYDCVKRLKECWINSQLKELRNNLKYAESDKQSTIQIMKKIEIFQKRKADLVNMQSNRNE